MKPLMRRIAAATGAASTAIGALALVAALLATMSLTSFDSWWHSFLCGVLAAAAAANISRAANSGWMLARRTAQLSVTRAKLAAEYRMRARAEKALKRVANSMDLVDRALPAILAYVDSQERVRYHNHAYTRWCGMQDSLIDGKPVADIIGSAAYRDVQPRLAEAMQGRDVLYERAQLMRDGRICHLQVQYLPHFDESGKVIGAFTILTDVTRASDVAVPPAASPSDLRQCLSHALEDGEFELYCQPISALEGSDPLTFQEVLVRSKQEEQNHLPPGAFLPVVEEAGMLRELDRWVVDRTIECASVGTRGNVYLLRLAPVTLMEPQFPEYVCSRLQARSVGGELLCFELLEADVVAEPGAYRTLIEALARAGCRFAISSFSCRPAYLRLFEKLGIEFVKLDGSIVLDMLGNAEARAKIAAINDAAHAMGIRTVADCVENDRTVAALTGLHTDFAQGFGIGKPRLMGVAGHHAPLAIP
jgi:PAS domain S-box-containing protein